MIATDVSKLLDLARNRTAEGRSALVSAIGDLLEDDRKYSAQELALMNDILKKLINDVARPIRKALAGKLAHTRSAPAEVIEILANDEIDVSAAILQHSELLTDRALIDIISKRTREHRLAIAMRKGGDIIALGQSLEWVNESGEEHEIDSTDEPDDADDFGAELAPGDRFRFTPDRTGTWVYRCKEHGDEEEMTITVH